MPRSVAGPRLAVLAMLAVFPAASASAQSVKQLGVFHDWSAYSATGDGGPICFVVAKPADVVPAPDGYTRAYLYLTDRPGQHISNEFNLVAGFPLDPGQPATLTVDGHDFPLFIEADAAWLEDPTQNGNLAGAMRAGSSLAIELVSDKGVKVRETFSLAGATAASKAMSDNC